MLTLSLSAASLSGNAKSEFRGTVQVSNGQFLVPRPQTGPSPLTSSPSYSRQWGSYGGPAAPNGIAVDSSGNIYVADGKNFAVQKLSPTGTVLATWGSQGSGPGFFNNPQGIALDSTGDVYVTDSQNNDVQKFTGNGVLVKTWGSTGSGNGQFTRPMGIAVNASGFLYVVDGGNQRVQVFTNDGTFIRSFGGLGTTQGTFRAPFGVAVDSSGFVYVDDSYVNGQSSSDNITKFTKTGTFVMTWGGLNFGGGLAQPAMLAVDNSSDIYAVDNLKNVVEKFNTGTGTLLLTWGSTGSSPGQLNSPVGVTLDHHGRVLVGDTANNRVQEFSSAGSYVSSLTDPKFGMFFAPSDAALDGSGNIYVIDQGNDRIQMFSVGSIFKLSWGVPGNANGAFDQPESVAVDRNGNVYVTDSNNNRVQKFSANGTFLKTWGTLGTGNGQFTGPYGIAVDSSNDVYVADSSNDRIEKFDSSGTFLTKWGSTGTGNGQFSGPDGVAIDPSGNVFVSDSSNNRIEKFTNSGSFIATWGTPGSGLGQFQSPENLAVDSTGNLYVADTFTSRVEEFTGNGTFVTALGTMGAGNGQLVYPGGVTVDTSGNIYVADTGIGPTGNNRIEVFSSSPDVGVSGLAASRNFAYSGVPASPINLTVTAFNLASVQEGFAVTFMANSSVIGSQNIQLSAGGSTIVSILWSTQSLVRGNYTLSARASTVSGEQNTSNNIAFGPVFDVRFPGDVVANCRVDIIDAATLAFAYLSTPGRPNWNPYADLDNDGIVNILDAATVAFYYDRTC